MQFDREEAMRLRPEEMQHGTKWRRCKWKQKRYVPIRSILPVIRIRAHNKLPKLHEFRETEDKIDAYFFEFRPLR